MSTMAVAWVKMGAGVRQDGSPDHFVRKAISRETVTTSGSSAKSNLCPSEANAAIVTAKDADLLVYPNDDDADVTTALGVDVVTGGQMFCSATPGLTKIAGIEG